MRNATKGTLGTPLLVLLQKWDQKLSEQPHAELHPLTIGSEQVADAKGHPAT